jgi:hypothetical protein
MASSYKALLISNSEFPEDPHNLFPLQGPVNDSPLLRDALTDRDLGVFDLADVRLLPERSKRDILTAVEGFFSAAERDDQLLLYYSGHGFPDINGNLYLCARDTTTSSLVATGVSDGEVNAIINLSAARAVIVILDCCYSGAFKGVVPTGLKGGRPLRHHQQSPRTARLGRRTGHRGEPVHRLPGRGAAPRHAGRQRRRLRGAQRSVRLRAPPATSASYGRAARSRSATSTTPSAM